MAFDHPAVHLADRERSFALDRDPEISLWQHAEVRPLELDGAGCGEVALFPEILDPLARVFDTWGLDRCLWGTDWTRAFAVVNYEQAVEPFRKTDRLSKTERAMLMGGACVKAYGWSPKKN